MLNSSISPLWTILGVIAIPVLLGLLAYLLMLWSRRQSRELAQRIDNQLLDLTDRHNQLRAFLKSYRDIDREPFVKHLDVLQSEDRSIDTLLAQHLDHFGLLVEGFQPPQGSSLQRVILAPVTEFRNWRAASRLRRAGDQIGAQVQEAEKRVEVIYELPWDLALECRKADEETAALEQDIRWLQENGTRGATLQKVASQLPFIKQGLAKIPDIFFDAGKEELLRSIKLDVALKVVDVMQTVRPQLDRYMPQVRSWRESLEKLTDDFADLKAAGASLRQTVAKPPSGLSVAGLQERLDQVAQRAAEIQQQITQPEADALKGLAREVHLLRQTLRATEEQLRGATAQLSELLSGIAEIHSLFEKVINQREATERADAFPLVWDSSSAQLDALRDDVAALGGIRQQRTPEQIRAQHKAIGDLRARLKTLSESTQQVAGLHTNLVQLLESSELQESSVWLRKARTMLQKAATYDPKNWPKNDSPGLLLAELEEISGAQERLIPINRALALKESMLAARLAETRALAQRHSAVRARVEAVGARLERLEAQESQTKERLKASWNILDRVSILVDNNDLLHDLAAKNIEQLEEELRQISNEMNAHDQGDVEKKASRAQSFADKVRSALQRWLDELGAALAEQYRQVDTQLAEVEAIARVDDRAVSDARGFLNLAQADQVGHRGSTSGPQGVVGKVASRFQTAEAKPSASELEALDDLKHKNDLWLRLESISQEVAALTQPVLSAYRTAVQARDEAREVLAEAQKRFPVQRAWPPANQPALTESALFSTIDEKWAALRQKPVSLDWTVQELERIEQQYQVAVERIRNMLDRIEEDQKRIQDEEWRFETLKQRWQDRSDPAQPALREGVKALLSETDTGLSKIRQKYLAGQTSYEDVLTSLRDLYDTIFQREITVDENTRIGLKDSHRSEKSR